VNAVLRGKFIALNAHVKKESSGISRLSFRFRKLDKEEEFKSKVNRKKEITQIRAEISTIENMNSIK
jgi:hypothetical protein